MDSRENTSDGAPSNSRDLMSLFKKYLAPYLCFLFSVLLYGLITALQFDLFHKSFSDFMNSTIMTGHGGDPIQFMWFLSWWPYALTHGLDPFQTHAIWSPSGVNLLWVTSVPGLSLLVWPFLHMVGPIGCYNILLIFSPILSASAAYLLAYEITGTWLAAFFGGYFFGFSSYEIIGSSGAPNLSYVVFVPLILFVILHSSKRRWNRHFSGFLIGSLLLFQFLVSTEILATFTIFLSIFLFCFYIFIPVSRGKIESVMPQILLGYLFLILLLIPTYPLLFHGQIFGGGTPPSTYDSGNDLLSLIIPAKWVALGGHLFETAGNLSEGGEAYLGLPLLLILFLVAKKSLGRPLEKGLFICLGIFFLASMGPTLHIAGLCLSTLPWTFFEHLPLIGYALANRFFMYSWLLIGLLIALWVRNATIFSEKIFRVSLIFLGVLFIWPTHDALGKWTPIHIPRIFSSGAICQKIDHGKKLIILPWGVHGDSELYQVSSGMCFTMPEGYIGAVPYPFNMWPLNYRLVKDRFDAVPSKIFGSYLATYNVGTIAILHNIKNESAAEALIASVGFHRTESIGSVDLYKSNGTMTFSKINETELKNIKIERERHLREKVIMRNRQIIKRILSKTEIISPKIGEDFYSWLLAHHILK